MKLLATRLVIGSALGLFVTAGCTTPAPTSAPTAPAAPAGKSVGQPASATAPAATGPAPTAPAVTKAVAPTSAPAVAAKVEPKGKLTYAIHNTITPRWLDPLGTLSLSDFIVAYIIHDAMIKPMPGNPQAPSLAESYETAPDFKSVTFKIRSGAKFHNGDAVTAEDVKWTYENYTGGGAQTLKEKTERIETPDARTVIFRFKEPFLDFIELYGGYGTGAGWILPARYYQQVGKEGFGQKPIGAGPYKFVSQVVGESFDFEAFADYWRKTPSIKNITIKGIPDGNTRLAALLVGEIDALTNLMPQQFEAIKPDSGIQIAAAQSSHLYFEFAGIEKPTSPYADLRVRQAISLALNRKALIGIHTAGRGENPGAWVTRDYPGALTLPPPEENLPRAKQLLAEAGHPNGFEGGAYTAAMQFSAASEMIQGQLREVGIRVSLNMMDRVPFDQLRTGGVGAFPDGLVQPGSTAGTVALQIRVAASCGGQASRICFREIDDRLDRYDRSINPAEREQLLREIQTWMAEQYLFVPFLRSVFFGGLGPRLVNKPEEVWGAMAQYLYLAPFEDLRLKD